MKNKVIGLICAMDVEVQELLNQFNKLRTEYHLGVEFYVGDYNENMLVITKCGIGKVNAGIITTLLIEHYNPDLIFNSGIAGGYARHLKTLDVVIATALCYSDVDMTTDNSTDLKYGQIQDLPSLFYPDIDLINKIKGEELNFKPHFGTIISGDQFVTDYAKTNRLVEQHFANLNVLACDMESCAIAHVCYLNKVPFIIVRAISDIIGSTNPFEYATFSQTASKNAALLVKTIINL